MIHGRPTRFVVETLNPGCRHFCSVSDVRRMLEMLPPADLEDLTTFVLRQPTRKQRLLARVWGRLDYAAQLAVNGVQEEECGPVVFLEAQPEGGSFNWTKALSPQAQAELTRLREDGHRVEELKRSWIIRSSPEVIRSTQLFRTLPHEIGHWVDYLEKVERPAGQRPHDYDRLYGHFFARPNEERETFAHRYADEQLAQLKSRGLIPFDPLIPGS